MTATTEKATITVQASINAPVVKTWKFWTDPKHIIHWNNASDDWHTPKAENDLQVGGQFLSRMEARDGSMGFDFIGEYKKIEPYRLIEYVLEDGRKVQVNFVENGNETAITEVFEAEKTNSLELQQAGWQAILHNFRKYVEASGKFRALHFEIDINAHPEKVFNTMLDVKYYAEWTTEFNPASHFVGSWEKGSKILFLGTDHNGSIGGMASKIKENIPNRYLSIEHLGIVTEDKEITSGPEVDGWAGAMENYTFTENNGNTLLSVDLDAKEEFMSYFVETWPKALDKLKEICER
jgi:uncharacterized protein YndB with AHSA1/START domain